MADSVVMMVALATAAAAKVENSRVGWSVRSDVRFKLNVTCFEFNLTSVSNSVGCPLSSQFDNLDTSK